MLNGFYPSLYGGGELITKLRIGDQIGWVNGSDVEEIGGDFNDKINSFVQLEPNSNGNLSERLLRANQMFSQSSQNKKVIILLSAGQVTPFTLITKLSLDPEVKVYTFGFKGLVEGQDLMSWLADETGGEA